MKLGTSLRFVFPTSPDTYPTFRAALDALPKGGFIERPMGAMSTGDQARNLVEATVAAREAGLDMLLVGDHHAVPPGYANAFSPVPTLARLMPSAGRMPLGMVLLAPFYNPVLLAEQIGTLAAFAEAPLTIALALGQGERQFTAFGMEETSRVGRLEELLAALRAMLDGEPATVPGRYHSLDRVQAGRLRGSRLDLGRRHRAYRGGQGRTAGRRVADRAERHPHRSGRAARRLPGVGGPPRP